MIVTNIKTGYDDLELIPLSVVSKLRTPMPGDGVSTKPHLNEPSCQRLSQFKDKKRTLATYISKKLFTCGLNLIVGINVIFLKGDIDMIAAKCFCKRNDQVAFHGI